jgi:signal transduction histidine kinase
MPPSDAVTENLHTILLADDEAHLRTLVRTTLEDPRYRIVEASTGTAALELARRERPDLVVLDLMMPGLTGLEVLQRLRVEPDTARVPIVMLTATGQEKDRTRALQLGADAYLVKPFSPLELLQTVEALRERTRELRCAATEGVEVAEEKSAGATDAVAAASCLGDRGLEPLEVAESQLALYARDLKQAMEAERAKAEELERANARLRLLDRLKSDFLSFISHELRTPLNALSAVSLFDPGADPDEQRELIELTREGYERLESFVARGLEYFDWLAISRRDHATSVDLCALVRRRMDALETQDGAAVAVELPAGGCSVRAREEDVDRLLELLLDNAVKFSRAGTRISAAARRDGDRTRFQVRDGGIGFPPELGEEIFQPFTIADPLHHQRGTGMSLALARAIVEAYGGTIRAESAGRGHGALFEVDLPS